MPNAEALAKEMAKQLIYEVLWNKKHNQWVSIPDAEKLITDALTTYAAQQVREAERRGWLQAHQEHCAGCDKCGTNSS